MTEAQNPPYRILIADDKKILLRLFEMAIVGRASSPTDKTNALADSLGESGVAVTEPEYELTCCTQGDEALAEFERAQTAGLPFATVFLDVRMPPGPDGVVTAERIRELDDAVPIVIVTGFSDIPPKEILRRIPPANCIEYVEKPCRMAEIRDIAQRLTQQWAKSQPSGD